MVSASTADVAEVDPALVLSVDPATVLRCVGRLDGKIRHHLFEVVRTMLRSRPASITVDIEKLRLADIDAANALPHVQRMAKEAGAAVRWWGVGADQLRMAPSLRPTGRPQWAGRGSARDTAIAAALDGRHKRPA